MFTLIQLFYQFGPGKHGVLECRAELDGMCRAVLHAQLAEHATPEVVLVFHQHFFLFAVFGGHGFRCDADGAVRAVHLAQAAGDALVVAILVVRHDQLAPEAVVYFQGRPVLRVFFRDLFREELPQGHFHPDQQGAQSAEKRCEVCLYATHNSSFRNVV